MKRMKGGGVAHAQSIFGEPLEIKVRGKHYVEPRGYAHTPGTGPQGETCKSCRHYTRVCGGNRAFPKCGLMENRWTHGRGSDILAASPACKKWEET